MKRYLIVIALAAGVLAAVVYVAIDLHRASEREVVSQFQKQQLLIAREVGCQIEQHLANHARDLQALSAHASVQHLDLKEMADDIRTTVDDLKADGDEIFVYDGNGTVVYSSEANVLGSNHSQQDFFVWAQKRENKGKVFVSRVNSDASRRESKRPEVRFLLTAPLYQDISDSSHSRPTGEFVGAVVIKTDLDDLFATVLGFISPNEKTLRAWLMDKDGTLLFQSDHPEMVLRNVHRTNASCLQCHGSFDYITRILKEQQGTVQYQMRDSPRKLAAFAPMTYRNASWIAVATTPYAGVTTFVSESWRKTVLLLCLVGFGVAGSSALLYRNYQVKVRVREEARQLRAKQALNERIRQSEGRYRTLFEQSPYGVVVVDPETTRPIEFNDVVHKQLGYSRDEFARLRVPDYEAVEKPEETKARIEKLLREGRDDFETRHRTKQGEIRNVHVTVQTLELDGRPVLHCIFRDITERQRASESVLRLSQRNELILGSAGEGILGLDLQGNCTFVNPAAAKMLGYVPDELIGRHSHSTWHHTKTDGSPYPREECPIYAAFRDGSVHRVSTDVFWRKDGTSFPIEYTSTPIREQGRLVGAVVTFADITERKRAEQVLEETNKRLSNALDELKTAHEQAVQQERLSALGTMASGIAHDFNNSLTAILGFSELLLNRPDYLENKEKTRSCIEMMNTAAQDAGNVVNRLREFYRHREKNEAFAPVDLNELVNQTISLTQTKCKAEAEVRGISVNVHTDLQEVPLIAGRAAELREALTNLILNAADAMPRGGTITIHTYRDDGYVVLEVGDTGTGMTQEVRRRCLDPFFTTKGERGTGLGLSMVYGILQRHQGTVDIETEVGKGTTFIIRLPVETAQPRPEPKAAPVDAVQQLHVLVVDDEAVVRKIIGDYLKIDGHIVVAANSGRDGLEKFRNSRFDLVLLDRAMPGMSGDQVATAIKSANPAVPVIMLTGFGSMMDAADEKPTGVDFIVGKPVTINALRAALSQAVASVN